MLVKLDALRLAHAAAKSDDKLALPIDCIQVTEDGQIVVTDGTILLTMRGNVEEPGLFDSEFETEDREQRVSLLISADTVKDFLASCRSAGKAETPSVVIAKKRKQINIATTDGVTTKRFDANTDRDVEKFPDVAKVLGGKRIKRSDLTLGIDVAMKLLRVLKSVGAKSVTFGIPPEDDEEHQIVGTIHVTAKATNGDVTGAIMPMRK